MMREQLAFVNNECRLIRAHSKNLGAVRRTMSHSSSTEVPTSPAKGPSTSHQPVSGTSNEDGRASSLGFLSSCSARSREKAERSPGAVAVHVTAQVIVEQPIPTGAEVLSAHPIRCAILLSDGDHSSDGADGPHVQAQAILEPSGMYLSGVKVVEPMRPPQVRVQLTPRVPSQSAPLASSLFERQSPQAYEAAVRSALLRAELWDMSGKEAVRRASDLRKDLERIEMQEKLTIRAIKRH